MSTEDSSASGPHAEDAAPPTPPVPDEPVLSWRQRWWAVLVATVGLLAAITALGWLTRHLLPTKFSEQRIVVAGAIVLLGVAAAVRARQTGKLNGWEIVSGAPLAIAGTVTVVLAAFTALSVIEPAPQAGCLNTTGDIAVTASADVPLFARPTPASAPKGLVVAGCKLQAETYCVGAVVADRLEPAVRDSRWFRLSADQGWIAAGTTVGYIDPQRFPARYCDGRRSVTPTSRLVTIDTATGFGRLRAKAPGAAFVGFATQLPNGSWERLGWDLAPRNLEAKIFRSDTLRPGAHVVAVSCLGFGQAGATSGAFQVRSQRVPAQVAPVVEQPPPAAHAQNAACNAGIPDSEVD